MADTAQDQTKEELLASLRWRSFECEQDLVIIMGQMMRDLSEPYPIYTYRYFVQQWPELTLLVHHDDKCIGSVVSKLEQHQKKGQPARKRGYVAMLSVEPDYRRIGLGKLLVQRSIELMVKQGQEYAQSIPSGLLQYWLS